MEVEDYEEIKSSLDESFIPEEYDTLKGKPKFINSYLERLSLRKF